MFIPSTFNSMEDYGNLLLMRLLLRFLSFLFHYFINEVGKLEKTIKFAIAKMPTTRQILRLMSSPRRL